VAAFSGWYLLLPLGSALCFVLIRRHSGNRLLGDPSVRGTASRVRRGRARARG
jgi:hypothetical protein